MKRLTSIFGHWVAKRIHKLKFSNPVLYSSIIALITGANVAITDPQVIEYIHGQFSDSPWVTRTFTIVSVFVAAILGLHTSQKMKDAEQAKKETTLNGQPRRKRKFLGR